MSSPSAPGAAIASRHPLARTRLLGLPVVAVASVAALFIGVLPASAAEPVGLGTAESFAVLAGSGITNTGPTTITGDVGTFPTPSETGFDSITLHGTNHADDAVTQGAKTSLVTAYNDAAGRTPVTNVPVELGGTTLLAGVYTSPTLGLTGTLTLDAQGDPDAQFVFQAGSTLIAEANSRVLLLNGANPCRVVWQVGSSATFKTSSAFVGDVLAQISITANTSATFQGRLLARDGAVTLDTNTITGASCSGPLGATPTSSIDGTDDTDGTPDGPGTPGFPGSPGTPGATPPSTSTLAVTGPSARLPLVGTLLLASGAFLLLADRRATQSGRARRS